MLISRFLPYRARNNFKNYSLILSLLLNFYYQSFLNSFYIIFYLSIIYNFSSQYKLIMNQNCLKSIFLRFQINHQSMKILILKSFLKHFFQNSLFILQYFSSFEFKVILYFDYQNLNLILILIFKYYVSNHYLTIQDQQM